MPNPYAAELAQGLSLQQAGKFAAAEEGYGRIAATASNLVEKIDRLSRKTQYVYDDLHRRIEENWLDGGDATIRTFAHTYDALGRLTALDETIDSSPGTNYAYAYDGLGRLTSETQSLIGLASISPTNRPSMRAAAAPSCSRSLAPRAISTTATTTTVSAGSPVRAIGMCGGM